jgi:hypothetical protein
MGEWDGEDERGGGTKNSCAKALEVFIEIARAAQAVFKNRREVALF